MESFVNDNVQEVQTIQSEDSGSVAEFVSDVETSSRKRKRNPRKSRTKADVQSESGPNIRSMNFIHFVSTPDPTKWKCKYCERLITYHPVNGTSGLKNHTDRCKKFPANLDRKQKLIAFEEQSVVTDDGTTESVSIPTLWQFDQSFCRKECAKMLITDELPFAFVEREGFRKFCKALNPQFVLPSRSTMTRDCYGLFIDEKRALSDFFSKLSSRVCLTTDTWTSGQNLSYMCLTAHFIDDNWNLHKRILNFCPIAGHSGELIGRSIEQCLNEWNLKRILTCTVDNASANDVALEYLRRRVNFWKGSVLDGKYMHMRCAAHILNLVVRDGLKDIDLSILKIRNAVRFVRSSPARAKSFRASIKEVGIDCKSLVCLDVETRWNSTYLMLESALKFKDAFDNMHSKGGLYTRHLSKTYGVPNENDWVTVKTFLPFLEIFYNATLKLSGTLHVTSNVYLPEITGIGTLIDSYCENEDENLRKMAFKMKEKHDKYWADADNVNVLMFIALILDPRYKWDFVQWTVNDSFDESSAEMLNLTIRKTLKNLYDSYDTSSSKNSGSSSSIRSTPMDHDKSGRESKKMDGQQILMNKYKKEKGSSLIVEKKSELDKYLSDSIEPSDQNFDILGWWKDCSKRRYPTLARLAKDVLAMPVSTVASESAFSTGGRVLDSFRTSLTPRMVEALICTQDWLRTSHGPLIIEECILDLEELEESMPELINEQPQIIIDESMVASHEYSFGF